MRKKILIFAAIAIAAAILVAGVFAFLQPQYDNAGAAGAQSFIDPSDQILVARGREIYARNCAACHGANLEGQPDWRQRLPNGRLPAPPHDETGHTWHHADALLIDIVKYGLVPGRTAPAGYESDMPAYDQTLSDADIVAVLAYIKSRWPDEVLEAQKRATLQDEKR